MSSTLARQRIRLKAIREGEIDPVEAALAASTALGMAEASAFPGDAIDQLSARPDFLVLAYPWLEATKLG